MKFELNNRLMGRIIGISMAAAVTVSWNVASQIARLRESNVSVTANGTAATQNSDSNSVETVIIPFHDTITDDADSLNKVYDRIAKPENGKKYGKPRPNTASTTTQIAYDESDTTTTSAATTATTAPATVTTSDTVTAETQAEQLVSNGKTPFNYSDVSSIASNMNNLGDFVERLNPTSFSWDASRYFEQGYVQISLDSPYGGVTLEVKPIDQQVEGDSYMIGGEVTGSVNAASLAALDWYRQNRDSGCSICSVTWLSTGFAIAPVRGINVGAGLAELTDHYLCVNGGATTLYKASDVITNEEKLNAILAAENAYTFVGGRLYTISGYLEKYYSGRADAYQFKGCDMVVQYGCNSIIDHNYTTGSWIIEYAIKDDVVAGITFMNKSYYKKHEIHGGSTSSSTSSTSVNVIEDDTAATTTTTAETVQTTETTAAGESGESAGNTESTTETEAEILMGMD